MNIKLSTIQKRENLNAVYSTDYEGNGGVHHHYIITDIDNPEKILSEIRFQDGPRLSETSVHGVLDSDLLEISRDRLKCFQNGPFASEYNAKALEHIELALMYMNRRVEDRIERQVLGTMNK